MTEQLEFGQAVPKGKHEADFLAFKATVQGGQVCNRFLRIAWGFMQRGQKVGAKAIVERIRWSMMCRRDPDRRFLINNNLTAYLARWAMETEPKLKGFFELRETGVVPTARQLARSAHGALQRFMRSGASAEAAGVREVGWGRQTG